MNDTPPPKPLVVTVRAEWPLRSRRQAGDSEQELTARLAAARTPLTEPTVVIHGDAKCAFQHVASALGACRQAGISELGITVRIASANNHRAVRLGNSTS